MANDANPQIKMKESHQRVSITGFVAGNWTGRRTVRNIEARKDGKRGLLGEVVVNGRRFLVESNGPGIWVGVARNELSERREES